MEMALRNWSVEFKRPAASLITFPKLAGDFSSFVYDPSTDSFTRTTPDHTVYLFTRRRDQLGHPSDDVDAQYLLVRMTDRNFNVTRYHYDTTGQIQSITDPVGLTTTFGGT